ncbi:52 kDa repressor of the inhibitor of the protein kinase [Ooceraea biroi]|uniref:52 kDa repressor of the inhibitor of the protein kinase n=1 Tax=Ooceraea biroi TaxID=2015173 RepID=A0A026VXY3_OOCBI|nr:52 kDa repressor of the inhibitor of the protein kinase [Ooceraea biroi]
MDKKVQRWCSVPGCMGAKDEKRHFFRFPKENDRWLQWIEACKRTDLITKGPNYAYRNCRVCHLHFEEKWLRRKTCIRLHPDAIPSIFFGPAFDENSIQTERKSDQETDSPIPQKENKSSDVQSSKPSPRDMDAEAEPKLSTSTSTRAETKLLSEGPPLKKLVLTNMKILPLKIHNIFPSKETERKSIEERHISAVQDAEVKLSTSSSTQAETKILSETPPMKKLVLTNMKILPLKVHNIFPSIQTEREPVEERHVSISQEKSKTSDVQSLKSLPRDMDTEAKQSTFSCSQPQTKILLKSSPMKKVILTNMKILPWKVHNIFPSKQTETESVEERHVSVAQEKNKNSDVQSLKSLPRDMDTEAKSSTSSSTEAETKILSEGPPLKKLVLTNMKILPLKIHNIFPSKETERKSIEERHISVVQDAEVKLNTSSKIHAETAEIALESLCIKKLQMKILRMKKQNNKLRQRIKRLQQKEGKQIRSNLKNQGIEKSTKKVRKYIS